MDKLNTKEIVSVSEISLIDIFNFLLISWKKLALSSLVGAVLGFGVWFIWGNYHAKLLLFSNKGIDIISLRALEQNLPRVASQIVERGLAPQDQLALYKSMSSQEWWRKTLTPNLRLTKSDIKDYGLDFGRSENKIFTMVIDGVAISKKAAIKNAYDISQFIRNGGAYAAINEMFISQQMYLTSAEFDINAKMNELLIDLQYKEEKLKGLEALAKRFPSEVKVNSQIVDVKDPVAKYLPIGTQIVAANLEINTIVESISRLKDSKVELEIQKRWLELATPMLNGGFDGLQIIADLLKLESKIRTEIKKDASRDLVFINNLRISLLDIDNRFRNDLVNGGEINIETGGRIKLITVCMVITFLLMLVVLFSQKIWAFNNR